MDVILKCIQEEQTYGAAPRKKKKNRLPKDKEKGCVSVEIWHGQKSKSNQRLESEEVKIQQF